MILNAEDKLTGLEYDIFCSVREQIAAQIERIQTHGKGNCPPGCLCLPCTCCGAKSLCPPGPE